MRDNLEVYGKQDWRTNNLTSMQYSLARASQHAKFGVQFTVKYTQISIYSGSKVADIAITGSKRHK
jgi:hypothetical protein